MHADSTPDADLTDRIIELAMRVHSATGPGLPDAIYQQCLCLELSKAGIPFEQQVSLPLRYDGSVIEADFFADIIVQNEIILGIKAVDEFTPLHDTEMFTYLHLSSCRAGLMINFNTVSLADGIRLSFAQEDRRLR